MSRKRLAALTVFAVLAAFLAASAAVGAQDQRAYAGAHVSFDTSDNAVVDYQVDGQQMFTSAEVEARSDAEERGAGGLGVGLGGGVDLGAVSNLTGANIAAVAEARTSANVDFEGSASMSAHDNSNAVLVLEAGGEEQLVQVGVPADAQAEAHSDVIVSTEKDGVEGSYIVVGEGEVTVNDEGNVTAHLGENARMVFRAHTDGASDDDEQQEQMIADGDAAAEVQFVGDSDEVDGAVYLDDTEAEGRDAGEDTVEVTVDRVAADGKVVMTTVSEAAVGASQAFEVTVDGEAAAEVDSYQELEAATEGDEPAYMVVGETSAESHAQVLVALDGFSERTFQVSSTDDTDDGTDDGDGGDGTDGDDGDASDGGEGLPGFGFVAALTALSAFALARRR